jgi:hypothetical protein
MSNDLFDRLEDQLREAARERVDAPSRRTAWWRPSLPVALSVAVAAAVVAVVVLVSARAGGPSPASGPSHQEAVVVAQLLNRVAQSPVCRSRAQAPVPGEPSLALRAQLAALRRPARTSDRLNRRFVNIPGAPYAEAIRRARRAAGAAWYVVPIRYQPRLVQPTPACAAAKIAAARREGLSPVEQRVIRRDTVRQRHHGPGVDEVCLIWLFDDTTLPDCSAGTAAHLRVVKVPEITILHGRPVMEELVPDRVGSVVVHLSGGRGSYTARPRHNVIVVPLGHVRIGQGSESVQWKDRSGRVIGHAAIGL